MLETLEDHNKRKRQKSTYNLDNSPELNGISCPECEEELYDTTPMMTLMSNPPQKNVHCECGWIGYRIA